MLIWQNNEKLAQNNYKLKLNYDLQDLFGGNRRLWMSFKVTIQKLIVTFTLMVYSWHSCLLGAELELLGQCIPAKPDL